MTEGLNESRYARLNRLRMAIEEKGFTSERPVIDSVRKRTERLRKLRLAKEAADRRAKERRSRAL
jgi:hypothetical protein